MSIVKSETELSLQDDRTKDDDLRALARMIEYASIEAKKNGLLLTGHLLDLAGWSLRVANPEATTEPTASYEARPDKRN